MNGNKIMCMEMDQQQRKIKVIDSYLFITMRLSKVPEAMGIPDLAKGYHPYYFTDLNYVGPMVGLEYFDLSNNGIDERKKFDRWYAEQQKKTYVFREAIYYYCSLDVDILRQGCVKFARLIAEITGIFPFYDRTCHTIAGLALKIYRANLLTEETIGQIPATGYGGNVNQSAIALCWISELTHELEEEGFLLRSKLSPEGEEKILDRFDDGYCAETNTIYQFHGCFFHGCRKCFDGEDFNKVNGDRFYFLRERMRRTTQLFKDFGYHVIEKWECDFISEGKITRNSITQLHHTDYFVYLNLNPRDALFGGRRSPAKLYYESKSPTEKARYYDYTSLYPYVQKKYCYPIKHPIITRGVDKCSKLNVAKIFGFIKCKILLPKNMLFPVLPVRLEKLTFALCATCAREQCKKCTHSDEQRALYGTWTSVEVHKALEHGYKILAVYEVYHYPHSKKIFDLYVDTFMKLKQESSGVPKNCLKENGEVDETKLRDYIEEYAAHEQVYLEGDKIKRNPGQRTVMKALLNSLWGKLAQNEDTTVV
jgi:G:T-mismatch repair DNA endonuclease (very short patch repair protein)